MPEKIVIDLNRLEEVASTAKNQKEAAAMIGVKYGTLVAKLNTDPEVKAAWNRGREASKSSEESQPAVQLDQPTQQVLAEIKDYDGIALSELEIALRPMEENVVKRAVHLLVKHGLAEMKGSKVYALDIKPSTRKEPATRQPRAPRTDRSNSNDETKSTASQSAEAAGGLKPQELWEHLPVDGQPLNGHTTEIVATLEMARVELLYQRIHREPSPKVGDVIERVESGLEQLVTAKAATA